MFTSFFICSRLVVADFCVAGDDGWDMKDEKDEEEEPDGDGDDEDGVCVMHVLVLCLRCFWLHYVCGLS